MRKDWSLRYAPPPEGRNMDVATAIAWLTDNPEQANAIGALAGAAAALLALVVSAISIVVSVLTARSQTRHNELTVRPLADVTVANYENSLRVRIWNNGTGPLIFKAVTVSDGQAALPSLIDWMPPLPRERLWTNYSKNFLDRSLSAGQYVTLLELTEYEGEFNFNESRDVVRAALAPLTVNVEYTDIYGKTMPPKMMRLDWFTPNSAPDIPIKA
jgi:hypothetical protein